VAKAGANTPDLLASSLAKGDALLHRGRQGPGQLGGIVAQGIMPRGHGDIHPRLQVSPPPQRANDPMADLLDHRGDVGIAGRLARDEARL
jgi:hypothetical protein